MDHLKRLQLKVLSRSLQSLVLNIIVTLWINLRSGNLTELKKNIPPPRPEGLLAATEALQAVILSANAVGAKTSAEGHKLPLALASSGRLAETLFIFHLLNFTGTETDQEPKFALLL